CRQGRRRCDRERGTYSPDPSTPRRGPVASRCLQVPAKNTQQPAAGRYARAMRPLPRYWARHHDVVDIPGRGQFDLRITGHSATSQEEADQDARRRFDQLIAQGGPKVGGGHEYYPDRYRPEEVLEEVHSPDGELIAVVSRNRYGAAVLNTDAVLITD